MLQFFTFPPALPGAEIRIAAALLFTGAAAYFDAFNKKWVPNYLVYGFLIAALALNIIFFEQQSFTLAVIFGVAAFALTYPLYRLGQLGGADIYILSSIALAIPYLPNALLAQQQAPPYPFIVSALAPAGVLFILHMLSRFLPFISNQIAKGKIALTPAKLAGPALLLLAFAAFATTLSSLPVALPPAYFAILGFLFVSLLFFSLFKDEIKSSMVEFLPLARLQEEDVLALEQMDKPLVQKLKLPALIDKNAIAALKKSRLKKVPVYTGMPFFLPYLFFGLLITILFGDLLSSLLSAGLRPV